MRQATRSEAIDYPVGVDNDYAVWSAFANHYWPALYFVDADGIIRDQHFGEGRYEQSERVIQRLLGIERELVSVEGLGVEAEADWDHLRTPETYLGYGRSDGTSRLRAAPRSTNRHAYELPERLRLNHWALAGEWTIAARERRARPGRREHRLPLPRARRAPRAVAAERESRSRFRVLLDGEPPGAVPRRRRRRGRQRRARGTAACTSSCAQHDAVRERTLEITFLEPGAEAYAFTFG